MHHECTHSLGEHGCGICIRNRSYDKRVWVHRMELESRLYEENSFLTLTYNEEFVPKDGSVSIRAGQLFLKRLRQEIAPLKIRYFFVGEYGDETRRPHYHAALFGMGPEHLPAVEKVWASPFTKRSYGHVMLAELNIATIRYIAGYVTKKMTSKDDVRLDGREPEFRIMSKGLGRDFVPALSQSLDDAAATEMLKLDIPAALTIGGRKMPLGRYLRRQLWKEIYGQDSFAQVEARRLLALVDRQAVFEKELQAMYYRYENSSLGKKMSYVDFRRELENQFIRTIEAQFKLNKKGSL